MVRQAPCRQKIIAGFNPGDEASARIFLCDRQMQLMLHGSRRSAEREDMRDAAVIGHEDRDPARQGARADGDEMRGGKEMRKEIETDLLVTGGGAAP